MLLSLLRVVGVLVLFVVDVCSCGVVVVWCCVLMLLVVDVWCCCTLVPSVGY